MTPAIDWAALSQQPPWGPWPPGDPQNPGCLEAQERGSAGGTHGGRTRGLTKAEWTPLYQRQKWGS